MEELSKEQKKRVFNPNNIFGKDKIPPYSNKTKPLQKSYFNNSESLEESNKSEILTVSENVNKVINEIAETEIRKEELTNIVNIMEGSVKSNSKKEQLTIEFDKLWTSTYLIGKNFNFTIQDEKDHKERAKELKFLATRNTKYSGYREALQFGSIEFSKNDLVLLIQQWEEFFA